MTKNTAMVSGPAIAICSKCGKPWSAVGHLCTGMFTDFDAQVRVIVKEELTKVLGFQQVNVLNSSELCGDHACVTYSRCAQPLSCRKWQGGSWS